MYESEKSGISWYGIFRKLLILILIMILVFGIIYFFNGRKKASNKVDNVETKEVSKQSESKKSNTKESSKKSDGKKKSSSTKNDLASPLKQFENGTLKYFTPNNLPKNENSSKTVKLKSLINRNIIKPIESEKGKVCDKNKSTATITKLKNNYKLTTTLVCGSKSTKKTSYVGCYSNCLNNKICKGESSSEYAICKSTKNTTSSSNKASEESASTENNKQSESSSNNVEANTSNKVSTNTNSNSTSSTTNSSNSVTNPTYKTYYKYKRCKNVYYCLEGSLNQNNECVVTKNKNYTNINGQNYQSSINSYYAPSIKEECEEIWSENSNLPGWEKTYITKHE